MTMYTYTYLRTALHNDICIIIHVLVKHTAVYTYILHVCAHHVEQVT